VDASLIERIKRDMQAQFDRKGNPDGFPAFHDVPIDRYVSDEFWELEQKHLWTKVWVMAGREEDVANPGDYFTFDHLRVPIIVVRGNDGKLRAFYNTCQHRGAPVVRDEKGCANQLRCQYHGWVYSIDTGELKSVPDERDFIGLCREEKFLTEIRCESWQGWIWVNQDPDAASLHEWFGVSFQQMEELCGKELRAVGPRVMDIPCNWKVTAEAFLEVYHFRFIHDRGGWSALDNRGASMGLLPNGCSRMVTPFSKKACEFRGMADWADFQTFKDPRFIDIPTVNDMIRSTSTAFSLFPNLISPVAAYGFPFIMFWPIDKANTRLMWSHYAPKDWEGDELPPHWQQRMDEFDLIMGEDKWNMAPMQRSLESPAMKGVVVNYQERRIWHFHETVDRVIGINRVPVRMRVEQLLQPYIEKD
jgi:phenylpropionate dioxygenase-like ring-hydroxylating dioxygenase large terminal subunit